MTFDEAIQYIHSCPKFGHKAGLDVMLALCDRLQNPQNKLKFVHIAGTNGKGSTAAMLSNILIKAGYKTGLNISPFVTDFCERFQINGVNISKDTLATLTNTVKTAANEVQAQTGEAPNEFEIVTAIAFLWFAQQKCDIVCLEVGLGGKCDATNVIKAPLLAIITRIGLDHMAVLGDSIQKIAAEKCGIIKKGCTVISYPNQAAQALNVIKLAALKAEVPLIIPELQDIKAYKQTLLQNYMDYGGYEMHLALMGIHQTLNAAMVVEAALALCNMGYNISDDDIINGIEGTRFAARIEIINKDPLIVLDGCHNIDSVNALIQALQSAKLPKMTAVIGIMQDKNPESLLKLLSPCFDTVYAVTPQNPRAVSAQDLAKMAAPYFQTVIAEPQVQKAIQAAKKTIGGKKGLCVCGSLYLAAEARPFL